MYYTDDKIDVLIFIEHKDREFDSSLKILKVLKDKFDISVGIASIEFDLFEAWFKFNPKVICIPYCKSEKNIVVKVFKAKLGNKVKFINFNYEQILSKYSTITKRPRDVFAKEYLYHFCWGQYFKDYLISNGVDSQKIYITGKPEIDILVRDVYLRKKSIKFDLLKTFDIDISKKLIFMPLNDGIFFEDSKQIEKDINRGNRRYESLILKKYIESSINSILDWIINLESEEIASKISIVIRPHPSVSVEQYEYLLIRKYGKIPEYIYIIKDYTVKEWIVCSDVCITNYSTVALDSALVGIPTFIVEHIKRPEFSETDWISKFPVIKDYSIFKHVIENNKVIDKDCQKAVLQFIDTSKDAIYTSSHSILSILKISNNDTNETIKYKLFLFSFFAEPFKLLRSFFRSFEMKLKLKKSFFVKDKIKYDFLDYDNIEKLLNNKN